ncbi:lipase family protein [Actinoallomurus liliacearum]|uniref:Lipase family protein n=1 Tax=Actinoallomurus liliacearum TaxID=1080073 RepID=A0ABP8TL16_9ACTN
MKYRLLGSLVGLLMTGAALTAVEGAQAVAAPAACDASDAAIYTPPAAVSAAPGTLLACEAVTLPKVPGSIPMKAWKVQYASTDLHGTPIAVSGTVAVPTAAWTRGGSRPVIGFNPGTLGLGLQCAFSKQLAGAYQDEYEGDQIAAILKAGYAVAATDGVGYLNGQTHTYVVGRNAGHALLDAVRTAFQVPGGGLSTGAKVGVWGYSEGGQASLWAAQLASSYAPELRVVGDAAGGVPGDLKITAAGLNGGPFAGFLLAAVLGLHTAYPSMPFDSLLNDAGRSAIQQGKTLCLVGTVTAFALANIKNYTKDALTLDQIYALSGPDGTWSDLIDAQKLGVGVGPAWSGAQYRIGFPVMQYRGLADEVIPAATEDGTHKAYCSAGVTTQWNTYAGDHLTADNQAINDVMSFFADRIAGWPTLGNC